MAKIVRSPDPDEPVEVNLKDPWLAAFYAWLWPGAGHLYQGRTGKGLLYMIAILSIFFFGLGITGGRAVYASFSGEDFRYPFICQFPIGLPAMPAVLQNAIVASGGRPLLGGIMAPPEQPVRPEEPDHLAEINKEYHFFFELGTVYTMIAGLLNVLAIYDAYAGPAWVPPEEDAEEWPGLDEEKPEDPKMANDTVVDKK